MDGSYPIVGLDQAALTWALDAIPPAFPLAASVAVNPVLGFACQDLAQTTAILDKTGGARLTAPRTWYGQRIADGEITTHDLVVAIAEGAGEIALGAVESLRVAARADRPAPRPLPLVTDLARAPGEPDWSAFVADRIDVWAAGYFDHGQALWAPAHAVTAFADWRAFAGHDLATELVGLRSFRGFIADLPGEPAALIRTAVEKLGLSVEAQRAYFLRLLHAMNGWSQVASHARWTARRDGRGDATLEGLLAVRLAWELFFQMRGHGGKLVDWPIVHESYSRVFAPDLEAQTDALLHQAYEHAQRRRLAGALAARPEPPPAVPTRPALQAVFCIDVRSEVLRRHLEAQDAGVATLGFAGFFGVGVGYASASDGVVEHRLPVLLRPQVHGRAADLGSEAMQTSRLDARAARAVERFKSGAVAAFAYVESLGFTALTGLLGGSAARPASAAPVLDAQVSLETRIDIAYGALKGMTLDRDFAPIVLLVGHGAHVRNNPHAAGLQCGACGGHAGDINARLLANLLNDVAIRQGLAERGLVIPDDTRFVAALHDTASDSVTLLDAGAAPGLDQAKAWLEAASRAARQERARRRPGAAAVVQSTDAARHFAEVRPEWGLAGCHGFIAAPRARTRGLDLDGAVFLHDYDAKRDPDFAQLEAILTAPVVVASWINLAYFGAQLAPEIYGGGDKLLHNVVGGFAVGEGRRLDPRPGIPWQSLRAEKDIHQPRRLVVVADAPRQALTTILDRHPDLKAWFSNGWISLAALDEEGGLTYWWGAANGWVIRPQPEMGAAFRGRRPSISSIGEANRV
ncbi:putative inorganic carbon transporter subunit DabA [Caulobacter sp. FWC2]|uniref:putative inorganic carbon transporter subunit DabA n=1 Tax=Caulobacter sp. FWC2 TaxID=69664 RepID=UPI001E2AB02E|nr:putative inorganic carbon transporter subunit DabA [Caulobacter sp. FWC2]